MTHTGRITRLILAGCLLALLSACGYHLRGQGPDASNLQSLKIFLQAASAPLVAGEISAALTRYKVPRVDSSSEADVILDLQTESFVSRVVSFDPDTGKVREFELIYQVTVSATDAAGQVLLTSENLNYERDYTFDDTAVLGAFSQDQTLRQEIARDAAESVLRRLQTLQARP